MELVPRRRAQVGQKLYTLPAERVEAYTDKNSVQMSRSMMNRRSVRNYKSNASHHLGNCFPQFRSESLSFWKITF